MAKLIAVANMKGGVGKTATVIGLAETLAARSIDQVGRFGSEPRRVLVVDLDAQASASFALAGDHRLLALIKEGRTIDGFLDRFLVKRQNVELSALAWRDVSDVSHNGFPLEIGLLASSPRLRTAERALIHALTRGGYSLERVENDFFHILSGQFQSLCEEFDYVIFDCPPGISMLTEIALRMSNLTIVPTVPDFLSLLGLDAFTQTVWGRSNDRAASAKVRATLPQVLVTQRRQSLAHAKRVAELRSRAATSRAGYGVLRTEVPDIEGVPQALERVSTYPTYAQKWSAEMRARLAALSDEVETLLKVPG